MKKLLVLLFYLQIGICFGQWTDSIQRYKKDSLVDLAEKSFDQNEFGTARSLYIKSQFYQFDMSVHNMIGILSNVIQTYANRRDSSIHEMLSSAYDALMISNCNDLFYYLSECAKLSEGDKFFEDMEFLKKSLIQIEGFELNIWNEKIAKTDMLEGFIVDTINFKDTAISSGFNVNQIVKYSKDGIVRRIEIRNHELLDSIFYNFYLSDSEFPYAIKITRKKDLMILQDLFYVYDWEDAKGVEINNFGMIPENSCMKRMIDLKHFIPLWDFYLSEHN